MSSRIFKKSEATKEGIETLVFERIGHSVDEARVVGGEVMNIERDAYEKGFRAGESAGFEFGRKKAETLFQGLAHILDELANLRDRLYRSCEKEIIDLIIAIARKVVHRELETKREIVVDLVREALKASVAGGEIVIRLNPEDLKIMSEYREELASYVDGVKNLTIKEDSTIKRGGCIVETNFGEVDATVDTIMGEIEDRLRSSESL